MPPRRPGPEMQTFNEMHLNLSEVLVETPLDPDAIFEELHVVEDAAVRAVAENTKKAPEVYERIHLTILKLADVDYDPPLSEQQSTTLAAKAGQYAMLIEASKPQPRRAQRSTATDVSRRQTTSAKG